MMNKINDETSTGNACFLCSNLMYCLSNDITKYPCGRERVKVETTYEKPDDKRKRLKSKVVIIINGKGGVGKDTMCDFAKEWYHTRVISSITPIKEIANMILKDYGYTEEKGDKERRLLSDLKDAFTRYNNLPLKYLVGELYTFYRSDDDLIFVHIREPEEIDTLKKYVENEYKIPCITLLIERDKVEKVYGNHADDDVSNYDYDEVFYNNDTLSRSKDCFYMTLFKLFRERGILN